MRIEALLEMAEAEKEIAEVLMDLLNGEQPEQSVEKLRVAREKLMTATRLLEAQGDE